MFGWKILTTIVITIGVLILALGGSILNSTVPNEANNTSVGGFIEKVGDFISGIFSTKATENNLRNITFSINASVYPPLEKDIRNSNITIESDLIKLNTTNSQYEFHKTTKIISFSGKIKLQNNILKLSGSYSKLKLSDVKISGKDKIKNAVINFKRVTINPMDQAKIKLVNATGKIKVNNINMSLENRVVEISNPKGKFSFSDRYITKGIAKKVVIKGKEIILIKK